MNHCVVLDAEALAAAQAGSEHLADAHVVAAAVELGGGLALTADAEDLGRLAASYANVSHCGCPPLTRAGADTRLPVPVPCQP